VSVMSDPNLLLGEIEPGAAAAGRHPGGTLRRALRLTRTRVGLAIVVALVLVALCGPLVAPHSPTQFVGAPFSAPGHGLIFGTDDLGRDVVSRFLNGGRSVIGLSLAAEGK